jgi:hypothetical protein
MDLLEQLEKEHQSNLDLFERVEEKYRSNVGLFERDEDVHQSSMNNIRRLEEECYNRRKHQIYMYLFRQAVKEYLYLTGIKGVDKQPNVEASDQQLCFKERNHQFVNLSGVMSCHLCGLETNPVFVPEYNYWDPAIPRGQDKSSISHRYGNWNFCRRRNITDFVLSGKEKYEIVKNIKKVYDAEEPKGSRLPNINILTYQICERLDTEIDETLLKIPKNKASHNRCKKIFQTLGWEYIE